MSINVVTCTTRKLCNLTIGADTPAFSAHKKLHPPRKKRDGRAAVIHTAESLHRLLHASAECMFETVRHDSEIRIQCRDGKVRRGNQATLEDCTPWGPKYRVCMRVKSIATGQGPGRKVSNVQAAAPKLKISKLIDRRSRKFDAVSLFTGTGHDILLHTLLRYKRGRVIAYDNVRDKEYINKRWEKRLSKRKLESAMLRWCRSTATSGCAIWDCWHGACEPSLTREARSAKICQIGTGFVPWVPAHLFGCVSVLDTAWDCDTHQTGGVGRRGATWGVD